MADVEKQDEAANFLNRLMSAEVQSSEAPFDAPFSSENRLFLSMNAFFQLMCQTYQLTLEAPKFRESFKDIRTLLSKNQTSELSTHWISSHLPIEQIERIMEVAKDVFEDEALAKEWLLAPNLATDNKHPINLLGSPEGYSRVFTLLKRIEYGNLA